MVRYIKYLIVVIVLLGSGIGVYNYFFKKLSPEAQIKKQLAEFIHNASKSTGDKLTTSLIKSKSLEKLFAPRCSFDVGAASFSGTYTPEQISSDSMRYRAMFKFVKFSVSDVEIRLTSPTAATADFTGELNGITKSGESVRNYRELTCQVQLIEGKWLISAVSVREIIKK